MAFEPRNLAEALAVRLVARADQSYMAGDWPAALPIYRHVIDTQPELARQLALALSAGHCEIELTDDAALDAWTTVYGPATGVPRERAFAHDIRVRAMDYCRTQAFRRASVLLRYISAADPDTAVSYAGGMVTRRSACTDILRHPAADPPDVFTTLGVDAWPVDQIGARHAGKRLLFVRRFGFTNISHGVFDIMRDGATRLGMTVRELNSVALPGPETDGYVANLKAQITSFMPHVIIYDELFLSGVSADPAQRDAVAQMLEDVRRTLGVRVVKFYSDVWYVTAHMPDDLFAHLGRSYDVVNHYHPAILDRGTDVEKASVFCYCPPMNNAPPTVAPGTIARACFVGTIHPGATPRIVWWAECMRAGLAFDFIETNHTTEQMSDQTYIDLLRSYQLAVNLTLRPTGARIMTSRMFEAPFAGTVLVEEDSVDTRYFMQAGVHYVPFETLPDLAELIPELLADAPRRQRIAETSQAFVRRYYTGDYYWAGLLTKLFP
jgi:hypothetical protein